MFVATRTSTSAPFGSPVAVDAVNGGSETPDWISDDGCRLYLERGDGKIYVAAKPL